MSVFTKDCVVILTVLLKLSNIAHKSRLHKVRSEWVLKPLAGLCISSPTCSCTYMCVLVLVQHVRQQNRDQHIKTLLHSGQNLHVVPIFITDFFGGSTVL